MVGFPISQGRKSRLPKAVSKPPPPLPPLLPPLHPSPAAFHCSCCRPVCTVAIKQGHLSPFKDAEEPKYLLTENREIPQRSIDLPQLFPVVFFYTLFCSDNFTCPRKGCLTRSHNPLPRGLVCRKYLYCMFSRHFPKQSPVKIVCYGGILSVFPDANGTASRCCLSFRPHCHRWALRTPGTMEKQASPVWAVRRGICTWGVCYTGPPWSWAPSQGRKTGRRRRRRW